MFRAEPSGRTLIPIFRYLKRISTQGDLNGYSVYLLFWIPIHLCQVMTEDYSQLPTLLLGAETLPTIRPS